MKDLLLRAADIIDDAADALFCCNTVSGDFTDDDDMLDYNEMVSVANLLRALHAGEAKKDKS